MLISVQAGNSDNKLTQQEWAEFVATIDMIVDEYQTVRHFFGGSITWAKWQNVCWVFEIDEKHLNLLKGDLRKERTAYRQDSVCVLSGEAEFV